MSEGFNQLGIPTSHTWHEIGCILEIIEKYTVNLFVELGFQHGGLGTVLAIRTLLVDNFHYLGIEIETRNIYPQFLLLASMLPQARLLIGDVFGEDIERIIKEIVQSNGRVLIYCDNGNKQVEFDVYSKILRTSDLIMVHDYPNEFGLENVQKANRYFKRLRIGFFEDTRIVLFRK